jgi:hypothetical protein
MPFLREYANWVIKELLPKIDEERARRLRLAQEAARK